MRPVLCAVFLCLSVLLEACNSTPAPTEPTAPTIPLGPAVPLSVVGYGVSLDSSYFKVWSDSSWDQFYGDTIINGTQYTITLDDAGNENLYGPDGYSGFGTYGADIVLFDSVLASLPDTMVGRTPYLMQTTFTYQGAHYVLMDQETLVDTTTVSLPFGTFTDCRVLQSIGTINGVLQYATDSWLAKGPSDIAREYITVYGAYRIQMAYGSVNGQSWGMNSRISPNSEPAAAVRSVPGIQTLAPMILRGMIRSRTMTIPGRNSGHGAFHRIGGIPSP